MSMSDIVTIISSLGFPIVMCGLLAWYVYQTTQNNRNDINKLNEKYQEQIVKMTETINNNTNIMQKLCEKIDNICRDLNENT